MVSSAKTRQPISRKINNNESFLSITRANKSATKVCKKITNTAPVTNHNAVCLPSFRFTFTADILINPGGEVPTKALTKPRKKSPIGFIVLQKTSLFLRRLKLWFYPKVASQMS